MSYIGKAGRGWKIIRVFICSTFKDIGSERDYLVRFVFPKLRLELLKWRVHLLDIDLRWGVTEEQNTLEVCYEIIDECRPRMICILGDNYGSIVPGKDKSYTAMEIEHSLFGLTDVDQHEEYRFFYFRNHSSLETISVEDLENFSLLDRNPQSQQKLKELKSSIKEAGFDPRIYPARWDTDLKCFTDLEAFGSYVYKDLLWSVVDELGEEIPEPMDEPEQEIAAMEAFAEDRASRFIPGSREGLVNELISFAEADIGPNILAVVGEPGLGKSALLSRFFLDYNQTHQQDRVIGHFVGASIRSADLVGTLRRFCLELSSERDISEDIGKLVKRFAELAYEVTKTSRIVIIIDALDQMTEDINPLEMNWLPANLPPSLRIIVSSADEKAVENLKRMRNIKIQHLEPLSPDDQRAILKAFLNRYKKGMIDSEKEILLKKEESKNPLYLLVALEELRTLGTREDLSKCLQYFGGSIQSLFCWILKNRLSNDKTLRDDKGQLVGESLVRNFAAYLASSRYGLTQAEIVDLVDPGDKRGNVAALQRLLKPYLMYRGDRLDFYHDQLRQAARTLYLDSERTILAYHRKLADYFKKVPADHVDRLVEEYPYQLLLCRDQPALAGSLSNLGLFEFACNQGRIQEWIGYWRALSPRFDPNSWYAVACMEAEKKGTILKNGRLYQALGWFLLEMEIHKNGNEGNYDIAQMMFYKSLYIHQKAEGPNHPSLAEAINGMAIICSVKGENERAMTLWKQVLKMRASGLGKMHPKVAMTLNNIGLGYYRMGDWKSALCEYHAALKIYSLKEDLVYAASADVYNNIGLICKARKRPKEALESYKKALEIMDQFFELYSPNKATVLMNMGDAYEYMGDYIKSKDCFSRALEISQRDSAMRKM
jgi:nephrocystin-3